MKFEVDEQTLNDLEIFDAIKNGKSVFKLFNLTRCIGGKRMLHKFLSSPLTDINEIIERRDTIAFFQTHIPAGLNVDRNMLDFAEYYLKQGNYPTKSPTKFSAIEQLFFSKISSGSEYYLAEKGVSSTIGLLQTIHNFSVTLTDKLAENDYPALLKKNNEEVLHLFSKPEYVGITEIKKFKAYDISRFDYMFRHTNKKDMLFFLNLIYEYDAFQAIAKAAQKYQFSYPEIVPDSENCLNVDGLFHPFVEKAVSNTIHFGNSSNLLFLSGPNMAGKSTFLKALGISVYLAHVGFPVPAQKMKINILTGLCTTINISDDLNSGYSHFYAEVMRVKDVANRLKMNNRMFVIFDELFRGTNVKDAYDGTLAIVSALANIKSSFFTISSHIVEVAKELEANKNIKFGYFEIQEQEGHPIYTYKLKEGISDIRLGMYIITKEGLIDLINSINNKE